MSALLASLLPSGGSSSPSHSHSHSQSQSPGSSRMEPLPAPMRQCWICYGEEEEDGMGVEGGEEEENEWVQPCQCRGTTAWVHQGCLLSWIEAQLNPASLGDSFDQDDGQMPMQVQTPDHANEQPGPELRQSQPSRGVGVTLVLPHLACPQCHAPYRLQQGQLLPLALLRGLQGGREAWRWLVVRVSLAGCLLSAYGWCWLYGAGLLLSVGGPGMLRQTLALETMSDTSGISATVLSAQWVRLLVGLPLAPLAVMSLRHAGLAWTLAPLLPPLLLRPGDLRWQWPPPASLQLLAMPLLTTAWTGLHRALFSRLQASLLAPIPTSAASAAAAGDDHDDHAPRLGLFRVSETLTLPFVAAGLSWLTGWLLLRGGGGRPSASLSLGRTLLIGGTLLVASDLIEQIGLLQGLYGQQTRRVLSRQVVNGGGGGGVGGEGEGEGGTGGGGGGE